MPHAMRSFQSVGWNGSYGLAHRLLHGRVWRQRGLEAHSELVCTEHRHPRTCRAARIGP
jgi:hypothetical protein